MPLPTRNYYGNKATITMMELRAHPGEVVDLVFCGLVVEITKQGRIVAVLSPPTSSGDEATVIHKNGNIVGPVPLTLRTHLGNGGYGE